MSKSNVISNPWGNGSVSEAEVPTFSPEQLDMFVDAAVAAGWSASRMDGTKPVFAEWESTSPLRVTVREEPGANGFLAVRETVNFDQGTIELADGTNSAAVVMVWLIDAATGKAYERGFDAGANGVGI